MRKSAKAIIILIVAIISTNVSALRCDEVADAAPALCLYWHCKAEHWLEAEGHDEWHGNAAIALIDILYAAYYEASIPHEKWTQFQDSLVTPLCYEALKVHRNIEHAYTMLTFTTIDAQWKLDLALEWVTEAIDNLGYVWQFKPEGSRGDAILSVLQYISEEFAFDS